MSSILPNGKTQFLDINGRPLVNGKVFYYEPNTETPKTTYADMASTTPNTNPVVLDARGEAVIWGSGKYRQVVQDSEGQQIYDVVTRELSADIDAAAGGVLQIKTDLANTDDAAKGDALIGVKQTATGGVARTQHDRNQEDIHLPDFGANDTAFSAVEALPAADASIFLPPGDYTRARDLTKTYVGPGNVINPDGSTNNMNAWRSSKIIAHDIAGRVGDITQLQKAISDGNVKVAIWGHSIAEGTNDIAYGDSWAGLFEQYCRDAFPGVTWTFVNYSIAGKDVGEANSDTFVGVAPPETPTVNFYRDRGWQRDVPNYTLWPSGSTIGKTWYNHIRDDAPDLVILDFGMNATSGDTNAWAATMKNIIINRIRTWTKVPSVAIMTDMLPTRKAAPFAAWNPILQAVADAARGVAIELNTTLLDANRLCRAYREGVDIAATRTRFTIGAADFASWLVESGTKPSFSGDTFTWAANGGTVRPASESNFIGSATFIFNNSATVFGMSWRADPTNLTKAYRLHIQPSVPQVVLYWNGVSVASGAIDPLTVGAGVVVKVESLGPHHKVYINSKKVIDVFDYQGIVSGYYGVFMTGAGTATKFRAQAGYARCIGYNEIPDEIMCGTGDELTNPNSLGGAGNHPSIIGHYTVYFGATRPLIQAIQREVSRWLNPVVSSSNVGTALAAVGGDYIEAVIDGTPGGACYVSGNGATTSALYTGAAFNAKSVVATSGQIINVALRVNGTTGLAATTLTIPTAGRWLIEAWGAASCNGTATVRNSLLAKATRVGG
ncbi:SGNH/GDSL hydrolase family protein [Pandoraea commovens]|uniref:Uncharacterized protein n=1 Tax=Pandoraea commovens TaxID=2508289 RepID=A0A5E4VGL5_9BURK|nr:SGNH/GDSL hydrolase family protein [Pandoraea commovens]VVE10704.1 hypothetical protein PCO31010_02633 [Pandoraea commovens]